MKLEALTLEQCQRVRVWRNAEMEVWRTSFMLTESMQAEFYYEKVSNRYSEHRYWAIVGEKEDYPVGSLVKTKDIKKPEIPNFFIGMGGITRIQFENSIGEITLIIDPEKRKDGLGEKAVDLLLDQAFNYLNLQTVFGECYYCNEAREFWQKITCKYLYKGIREKIGTCWVNLPNRKYWKGLYYQSLYFSIDKDDFNKIYNSK